MHVRNNEFLRTLERDPRYNNLKNIPSNYQAIHLSYIEPISETNEMVKVRNNKTNTFIYREVM